MDVQFDCSDDVHGMDGVRTHGVIPNGIGVVGTVVEEPGKGIVGHLEHTINHWVAFH